MLGVVAASANGPADPQARVNTEAFSAIRERLENGTYKRISKALIDAMGE